MTVTPILRNMLRRFPGLLGSHPKRIDLEKLLFIHLPKCGGSSVHAALQDAYARNGLRTTRLDARASRDAAGIADDTVQDFRIQLLIYHLSRERNRYVAGHYAWSETVWEEFGDQWNFMTVLREPVARWYSSYFYNRYKDGDHFRIRDSLDVFVESETARAEGDMYVRLLTADRDSSGAVGRAIENLQRFHLVGVLEDLDALVRDCRQLLGIDMEVGHRNAGPWSASDRRDEITPEIDRRVRQLCEPNLRVYEAVRERIASEGSWLLT